MMPSVILANHPPSATLHQFSKDRINSTQPNSTQLDSTHKQSTSLPIAQNHTRDQQSFIFNNAVCDNLKRSSAVLLFPQILGGGERR
mmetsp:Transcript_19884/g.55301  ORF Transcript_19884/g.55301 Transcript_19884/m.55301 type:complete len:87 (+) Transcript_19884:463-723(+)